MEGKINILCRSSHHLHTDPLLTRQRTTNANPVAVPIGCATTPTSILTKTLAHRVDLPRTERWIYTIFIFFNVQKVVQ